MSRVQQGVGAVPPRARQRPSEPGHLERATEGVILFPGGEAGRAGVKERGHREEGMSVVKRTRSEREEREGYNFVQREVVHTLFMVVCCGVKPFWGLYWVSPSCEACL